MSLDLYLSPYRSDASLEYREKVLDAFGCSECGGVLDSEAARWHCCDCNRTLESSESERTREVQSV